MEVRYVPFPFSVTSIRTATRGYVMVVYQNAAARMVRNASQLAYLFAMMISTGMKMATAWLVMSHARMVVCVGRTAVLALMGHVVCVKDS